MRSILLAVALQHWERSSAHALAARDVAAALVHCPAQHLHVLSVYTYPTVNTYGLPPGLAATYRDEQMQGLDISLRQKIAAYVAPLEAAGIQVSKLLREGQARQVIVQVASEIGAELLIIGTHSKRSRWNSVLGGIAVQLQKYAPCPVILVSPPRGIGAVDERGGVGEQACQNRTRHAEDAAIVRVGSGIDTTEGLRLGCACTQGPRYIAANG